MNPDDINKMLADGLISHKTALEWLDQVEDTDEDDTTTIHGISYGSNNILNLGTLASPGYLNGPSNNVLMNTNTGNIWINTSYVPHHTLTIAGKSLTLSEKELEEFVEFKLDLMELSKEFPAVQEAYDRLQTVIKLHKE